MITVNEIIKNLSENKTITIEELEVLISAKEVSELFQTARAVADQIYGKKVFKRGLIEFTNYCKNDCFYCGIRRSNAAAERYRLEKDEILECCRIGYAAGYRTFVLQGGEDPYFTDARICEILEQIHTSYPDCAITLSIGEKSKESYQGFFDAGADRYLLRHETADACHYQNLHPKELSLQNRMECLWNLKAIGFQTGCGFMVGSPGQTIETLHKDLMLIRELKPHMVGIGPFIPHAQTPFANETAGSLEQTLRLLSIVRLLHPHVLLPSTTALGTIHEQGREMGILAGANVVMPNLSPSAVRRKYRLYDNKVCDGEEAVEGDRILQERMQNIGYELVCDRGDYKY